MSLLYNKKDDRINDELIDVKALEKAIEFCLQEEGRRFNYEVSLSIVDAQEIRQLNRDYRNMDATTDVLSFPLFIEEELFDEVDAEIPLGDIIISYDSVLTQAREYGHSVQREFFYLFVHSMFHLLGYDHESEEDKMEMREKEEKVLSKIGVHRNE